MSQLLAEALQDVRWAEAQLGAAATAVLARNGTHARNGTPADPARLPPAIGQPKLWWLPAAEAAEAAKPAKPANARWKGKHRKGVVKGSTVPFTTHFATRVRPSFSEYIPLLKSTQ